MSSLFPIFDDEEEKEEKTKSLIQHQNTSWLNCSSAPVTSNPKNSSSEDEDEKESKEERKKRKKEKKRKRKEEKEKLKIIDFEKKRIKIDPRSQTSIKDLFPKDEKFEIDTKGDANNLVFEQPYRTDIPKYLRFNSTNPHLHDVLKWKEITKKMNTNQLVYRNGRFIGHVKNEEEDDLQPESRYFKGKILKVLDDVQLKRIHYKNDTAPLDEYIPLTRPTESTRFFRVVQDSNLEEEEDSFEGESFEEYIFRKTKEFNTSIQKEPKNIETWLNFVKFQDEYLKLQKRKNYTTISEKKILIYEAALKENPNSVPLLVGHLKESREILPHQLLESGWRKALSRVPESEELWREYFLFKKSIFSEFNCTNMRNIYGKCFATLYRSKTEKNSNTIEKTMLSILYDYCIFEKESGYTEKSIAIMQAMIELNLFNPFSFASWSQQLSSFRDYWQQEAPRIGEKDAVGWKQWLLNVDLDELESDEEDDEQIDELIDELEQEEEEEDFSDISDSDDILDIIQEKSIYTKWLNEEEKQSQQHWSPCRPLKDSNIIESCADRIVMFEDLKPFLFQVSSENYLQLVFLFLELLGVSVIYTQKSVNDSFVHESLMSKDFKTIYSIFNSKSKFDWKPSNVITNGAKRKFIKNVFQQVFTLFPNEKTLEMTLLDFESDRDVTTFKNAAKDILSKDPDNIYLYNYYAQILIKKSQIEEAKKVYSIFLEKLNQLTNKKGSTLMYRCYAELEYDNKEKAIQILCSCVDGKSISNTTVDSKRIKSAKVIYTNIMIEIENSPKNKNSLLEYVMCFALLEDLTNDSKEASRIFETVLEDFKDPCNSPHSIFSLSSRFEIQTFNKLIPKLELGDVYEQYLWLLYFKFIFVHKKPKQKELTYFTNSRVRSLIETFLLRFPGHPLGLSLYIELEMKLNITSRSGRFFNQLIQRVPSPILYLFAIYSEMKRGNTNKIRSLFEKAFENQVCKANIILWRMYLRFEVSHGNLSNGKKIFYRSIDKVPYAKSIWIDIMKLFDHLNVKEIQEIVDLMNEKEILLRTNIEDFVI
eukprot:gene10072-2493_t